jgi:PD-(D/E)XK nuclease superfamily
MKITPSRTGSAEFLTVFKKAIGEAVITSKADPSRLFKLRCSQLPYCPRSVIMNYVTMGMYQSMDMRMAYYVGVGHAVHHVMQTYLALSGRLLADYSCRECGTKYPLSHKHECCGFPTHYEEVTINWKGIGGHIDAIFKDSKGRYWILDFKTSSLSGSRAKRLKPGPNYERQVKAYAYLLWRQYGIKVEGVMLIFLPRDNPWSPTIWELRMTDRHYEAAKAELLADRKLHKRTMVASTLEEVKSLFLTNCGGEYCDWCKKPMPLMLKALKPNLKLLPIKESAHV